MNIILLNESFIPIAIIDAYESFIWTDRYNSPGDFEYYAKMDTKMLDLLKQDRYLVNDQSDRIMIIESVEIESSSESGDYLRVSGRSFESILNRRIVWAQTNITGSLQNGVKKLINDSIISPSNADRKIEKFIFYTSTDQRITDLTLDAQYTGDNVGEVINNLCMDCDIGYKIIRDESGNFVFYLYSGTDRSSLNNVVGVVTFSPNFDNVISSDYRESTETLCNVTLVAGEGEGTARKTATVGSGTGITRREIFTDARDISSNDGEITSTQYTKLLKQKGKETLAESKMTREFTGEMDAVHGLFKYGKDFLLGDIVDFEDGYGNVRRVRVTEIIFSENSEGTTSYPTLTILEEE